MTRSTCPTCRGAGFVTTVATPDGPAQCEPDMIWLLDPEVVWKDETLRHRVGELDHDDFMRWMKRLPDRGAL